MKQLFFTFLLVTAFLSFGQKSSNSMKDGSIADQFDYVYSKSGNYQEYKVIKKTLYKVLKKNVLDSIQNQNIKISETNSLLKKQSNEINTLSSSLDQLKNELKKSKKEKNSLSFLGIKLKKGTFLGLMWSIFALLLLGLIALFYLYNNNNKITKKANEDLKELEIEFKNARTRALEREQTLNRKLQDEINKQKNSNSKK